MKLEEVLQGLRVLSSHYRHPTSFVGVMEERILSVYETDNPLSDKELYEMISYGWYQEHKEHRDFSAKDYDITKNWVYLAM